MCSSDLEEAALSFEKVHTLDPDNVAAIIALGDCYEKLCRFAESVDCYEHAFVLEKYSIRVVFRLIMAYYNVGENEKATSIIREIEEAYSVLQVNPDLNMPESSALTETYNWIESLRQIVKEKLDEKE